MTLIQSLVSAFVRRTPEPVANTVQPYPRNLYRILARVQARRRRYELLKPLLLARRSS